MPAHIQSGSGFPERSLIIKLSEEARVEAEVVEGMLREEFAMLAEGARITQFIDVLATSRVKSRLRKLNHEH
jgi:hypothetical protein